MQGIPITNGNHATAQTNNATTQLNTEQISQDRKSAALNVAIAWQKMTKMGDEASANELKRTGESIFGDEAFGEALAEAVEIAD
ncbi:hypothetical protein LTR27_000951 [Elasticomyces elasticus]|nr:hypothetical protein LTR27_000951 [Elasticomyces elasticus]